MTAATAKTPTACSSTTSSRSSSSRIPATRRSSTCNPCEAIGIDPRPARHPLRRGQLGIARPGRLGPGLGGLVDGQEITQFTYFQQAGGMPARPGFGRDYLRPGPHRHGPAESAAVSARSTGTSASPAATSTCKGNRSTASTTSRWRTWNAPARCTTCSRPKLNAALKAGLVLPAYDYLLKCSHTFNILDTRGAVGVTERQVLFGRMRELSRRISEGYLESRRRLEYPWLDQTSGTIVCRPG